VPRRFFAGVQINARFAADCRVDLGKQRCRNLHDRNSAHENRGQKSADIPNYAAAQSKQDRLTVGFLAHHLFR
jgi:hypothetical protein